MGALFDLLPILIFFVVLKMKDVYIATGAAVVAAVLVTAYQYFTKGKVEKVMMISTALLVVFGGLTIWLQDETFIIWKPTVLQGLLAIAFFASRFIGKEPIAQRLLGKAVRAPRRIWLHVNDGLAVFFIFSGVLNIWVAKNYDLETWALFKLWGFMGLNFVAMIIAVAYLAKKGELLDPKAPPAEPEQPPSDTLPSP